MTASASACKGPAAATEPAPSARPMARASSVPRRNMSSAPERTNGPLPVPASSSHSGFKPRTTATG